MHFATFILILCIYSTIAAGDGDSFSIQLGNYQASATTAYYLTLIPANSLIPSTGSALTMVFPNDYNNILVAGPYTCVVTAWAFTPQPTTTCSVSGLTLTVNGLFSTSTDLNGQVLIIQVQGITNPHLATTTGYFSLSFPSNSGTYTINTDGNGGLNLNTGTMSCTITTTSSKVNQNGVINFAFVARYFPVGSSLQITFPINWPDTSPVLSYSSVIQAASVVCLPITNSQSGISCSYIAAGSSNSLATVSNIVGSSVTSATISFSFGPILTPPTTQQQGSFTIASLFGGISMSQCTGVNVINITSGQLASASFVSKIATVNALTQSNLNFITNSNIIPTDIFMIEFPSTIPLSGLTSIYVRNGDVQINSPVVSGQQINITGVTAYQKDLINITFSNINNPTSELVTSTFQISSVRNGYFMDALASSLTFSATRATITSAAISSTSVQIGVTSSYTITFTLAQPLGNPQVVVGLPTMFQGLVGSCSPSPCSITSTEVSYNISATTVGSSVSLVLSNVVNPYTLGTTTSLTLYTLHDRTKSTSIVQYVNSGITLTFIARSIPLQNVVISSSSMVVINYPTTITLKITNMNRLPSYTYLQIYIPPEIAVLNPNGIVCLAGLITVSCTFNTVTNMLTLSYFSSVPILAGQLVSSPVQIMNLVNPASTQITSSFGVYLYNSLNQVIEFVNAGLSYQVTIAANFYSFSLMPNNSINSAPTKLTLNFNVPGSAYNNNTLLILIFPSQINIQSTSCSAISANILSISCSVNSNNLQVQLSYIYVSTNTSTQLSIQTYNNYPSLKPYTIQVDLYQDTYMQYKLCSNVNSLIPIQNTQVGSIYLSYSFSASTLLTSSNLNVNINATSSVTFSYLTITLPLEFAMTSVTCSVASGLTCTFSANTVVINSTSTITVPMIFTLNNIMTPSFTPSSNVYIQSYTSGNYMMDANTVIQFTTICTLPCKTCSSVSQPTICTSCYGNTSLVQGQIYLNNSLCVASCNLGYYMDNTSLSCALCSPVCLTCSSYSVCLSCNTSYFYNTSCLINCTFGYYGFNSQCLVCPTAIFCQSCMSSHQCLTCIAGYYYYNYQCLTNCPQPITYTNLVNRTCDACPLNCTNCQGNSTLVICTVCNPGYVFDNSRCYLTCVTAGLIATNGTCSGCNSICLTCSVTIYNCTSCHNNSSSQYLYGYSCISQCPNGYYQSNLTYTCLPCSPPCEYCYNSSINSCISCITGHYLYQSGCQATCPTGYYNSSGLCNLCVSPCVTCSQELICLSCINNTYLYQGQCLPACPTGMTIVNGNECLVCLSICLTCSSTTTCTSCYNSTFLYNGTCLSICPNGTYPNTTTSVCSTCVTPCLSCTNSTFCSSCIDTTKFLVSGSCVSCTSPCQSCSGAITNCTSCLTNTSTPYYFPFSCLPLCPYDYFSNNVTYQCTICVSTCLTCSGSTNSSCLSCMVGYYWLSNACYFTCPSTYFNNLTNCSACQSPCQTCSSAATICLSCIVGKYLYGTACQDNCSNGTTIINGNMCSLCSVSCKTCLQANTSACTSCYLTTYLIGSICNYTCPNAFFADSSSNTCIGCFSPCFYCVSSSYCTSCLDISLFIVNGSCLSCSSPCLTCSGLRSTCTSCNTSSVYSYLVNQTCLDQCPNTFYGDSTFLCYKCTTPCQTCSNASNQTCLSCISGYYQLINTCFVNCPPGYFQNITVCSACTGNCQTCSDSTTCLSCVSNFYLFGSNCVTNCSVGMMIINGTTCQYCASSCNTCQSSNSSSCTSCISTTYLYNAGCVTQCPNTKYSDNSSNICQPCLAPCANCQSLNFCLSCIDSTAFLVNGSCQGCQSPCSTCSLLISNCTSCSQSTGFPYLLNNKCLDTCPLGYYNQLSLGQCLTCISPCATCTNGSTNLCNTCISGHLLLNSTCLPNCPGGYYSNNISCNVCSPPCQNCFSAGVCLSCVNGTLLQGSWCVTNCSSGTTVINNTYCQICNSPCLTCFSSNISYCTSCNFNLYMLGGTCYVTCPATYFGNSNTSTCLLCQSPCANCSSLTLCLSCLDAALFLVNSSCVGCLSPCLTCSIYRYNCTSCDTGGSFPYLINSTCIAACPSGKYSSGFSCVTCTSPCQTCSNSSTSSCITCLPSYLLFSNTCLPACPASYYSNSVICLNCSNGCATCSSSTICLSCPATYYLLGSVCNSTCPNGMISGSSAEGGVCQFCSPSCNTCMSSNTSFCTSCSGTYLFNGQCVTNCSSGYYANNVTAACSACQAPCSTCYGITNCLSCTVATNFLINFSCVGCQYPCLTCSLTITNCTSCNTSDLYPYFYGSTCLSTCPSAFYNDASFVCLPCTSPCLTCNGVGFQSCLTCITNYLQLNTTCYSVCPSSYYGLSNQCVACSPPCLTCTGPSTCTSCTSGLYLLGSLCQSNCSGMATNGSICLFCSPNCLTCFTNNNSFCTSCNTGLFLFSGSCQSNCSSGLYGDSTAKQCLSCDSPCATCTSSTSCLSCLNPSLFLVNSTCTACASLCLTCSININNCTSCNPSSANLILFNNNCVTVCPVTYYNNTPTTCAKCNSPCDSCSSATINSCLSCLTGYYLLLNTCYSICPATYFSNTTNCSSCSLPCSNCLGSSTVCISCQSDFYLSGSTCVTNCSAGQVIINGTICQSCFSNCLTCLSSNSSYCTSCSTGTYLYQGTCIPLCPSQFYPDANYSRCDSCISPCLTCSSTTQCLSCALPTLFLINFNCVTCSSTCLTCSLSLSNCTSCNTTSTLKYLFNYNCLASCPSTYYDGGSFNCLLCNSPCQTCSSSSTFSCLTCLSGYSQLILTCYVNCPATFYSNSTYCLACDSALCNTCITTNSTCLSCHTGLYLQGSSCVGNCSSGMIVNGSNVCVYCNSPCQTCLNSNISYCTSCYTSNFMYLGTCGMTCPTYFFADNVSQSCRACQSPCSTCMLLSSCLTCINSLNYLQNFQCVSACTYPLVGINQTCYLCSSQCLTCTQTVSTCLLCSTGFYYTPATFACSLFCSLKILSSNLSSSGNNECTQTCPQGTYNNGGTQYCLSCPTECQICSTSSNCTQCSSGYSYYSFFCYSTCPLVAPYSINFNCTLCNIANCITCLNTTYCSSCASNYLLIASGNSSSCISSCPSGYVYNLTSLSCGTTPSDTTNQTVVSSNIVRSSVPDYSFLITTGCLVAFMFIAKFNFPEVNCMLSIAISLAVMSTVMTINLLYLQIQNSGIQSGDFSQVSASTYLLLSAAGCQVLVSVVSIIVVLKVQDAGIIQIWKTYPITLICIMMLSLVDSNIFFILISGLMNLSCFSAKFMTLGMNKLFKMVLIVSLLIKLIDISYSALQLNFFQYHAHRLLINSANFPIDNSYTTELLIVSLFAVIVLIYLIYHTKNTQKVQPDYKSDSNQSLDGDDSLIFDKRNQSNSQIVMSAENSDLAVDINSIQDEKELSQYLTRRLKAKKVTPDEMLQAMNENQGKQEIVENSPEIYKDNDVLFFMEEEERNPDMDKKQSIDTEALLVPVNKTEEVDNVDEDLVRKTQQNNNAEADLRIDDISDIIYVDNAHQDLPEGETQTLQKELHKMEDEHTKTEFINLNVDHNDNIVNEGQKYSPSEISEYQPNKQIQREFANSYLDDANKFNEYTDRANVEASNKIQFEVVNGIYNEDNEFEEISFSKKEMDFEKREEERRIEKMQQDIREIMEQTPNKIVKINEEQEQSYREENTIFQQPTPFQIQTIEEQEMGEELKPSQGLKGSKKRRNHRRPQIPLPKNQVQKQIMSIYQTKQTKEPSFKKKRYPDIPIPKKNAPREGNFVEYSVQDKDFLEEVEGQPTKKIGYGGSITLEPRYNRERASGNNLVDEEMPGKPSLQLRKSSFKKIGELVVLSQQSSRK